MQKYELMVVLKPLLVEDIKEKVMKKLEKVAKDHKANLEVKELMGKRLLAYPIKKYKEGYYVLFTLEANPAETKDIEKALNLTDEVLRFLLVKEEEL